MLKILKTMVLPIVFVLAILVSAVYATESENKNNSGTDGAIIIDVRTEAEWTAGHLDGAILIPYERIGDEIATVAVGKKDTIYLYCRSGRRSKIAEDTLEKAGYENLINLKTLENAAKVLNRAVVN